MFDFTEPSAIDPAGSAYRLATQDMVRAKNRLKAVLRARGVLADGRVYEADERVAWLERPRATLSHNSSTRQIP